jgi:hypothetical protein
MPLHRRQQDLSAPQSEAFTDSDEIDEEDDEDVLEGEEMMDDEGEGVDGEDEEDEDEEDEEEPLSKCVSSFSPIGAMGVAGSFIACVCWSHLDFPCQSTCTNLDLDILSDMSVERSPGSAVYQPFHRF